MTQLNKYIAAFIILLYPLTLLADNYSNAWDGYHSGRTTSAMQIFSELAKEGNIYAQAIMGVQYAAENRYIKNKPPTPYNPSNVFTRITELHNAGDIEATFLLALMHDEGWAANKNEEVSKVLYIKAAKANHIAAQTHLAEYYELGVAGDKDLEKAIYWYKKAEKNGSAYAKQMLIVLKL